MHSGLVTVFIVVRLIGTIDGSLRREKLCEQTSMRQPFEEVIDSIVAEISRRSKCIVFVSDTHYKRIINFHWVRRSETVVPIYVITIGDRERFNPPRARLKWIISDSKDAGCNAYVILMANPLRVSEFLRYMETERLIDTRGLFVIIHDWRLFEESSKYLWNRITNVVFIRVLNTVAALSMNPRKTGESLFNLETVHYPVRVKKFVLTRYIDAWYRGKFRNGRADHFPPKVRNLKGKSLKVAVLSHVPAVTRFAVATLKRPGEKISKQSDELDKAFGIEFEIINVLAKKMNFVPKFYGPHKIDVSRWGRPRENGSNFDGLIGESVSGKASFLIGDLHYTPRHNKFIDLSLPYNTECLTFLTPEAINDNSWKLLIVPFKLYTWIVVIVTLIVGACIFNIFALAYRKYIIGPRTTFPVKRGSKATWERIKVTNGWIEDTLRNLEMFTEPGNSIMYTYSMLLQVSLPRIPTAWALRVFIGWWWLYSILVTVAYRASMTATLANPITRVTIDTIPQLVQSGMAVGGWTDEQRDLFLLSSDTDVQKIGQRFELTTDEEEAIARVADGSFCYYENIYVLKEARAMRQRLEYDRTKNGVNRKETPKMDRDLHIMGECLIDMPISIGMDKNSPLKPQVDRAIRRIAEAGFVAKWLGDATEWTKIVELRFKVPPQQTLVNLHKLHGALVALATGYFVSLVALIAEKLQWKYMVQTNPRYDKYQMDVFYAKPPRDKIPQ